MIEGNQIDLLVMGTRGRSGIGKFLLGSVAEEIFRQAPLPSIDRGASLAVRTEARRRIYSHPVRHGLQPRIGRCCPLCHLFRAGVPGLLDAIACALQSQKRAILVHPSELTRSSEQLLRNLVPPEAELWCAPENAVERGVAAEKILEVAAQSKVDLIVLGVRQPSGFPGAATHLPIAIAHKVVSDAACPVLTVRG